MNPRISLTISEPLYRELFSHLFPGDGDEHGAVIAAGITDSERGTRLLARDLFLARDGIDYIPGTRGYRALSAQFVAEMSDYCARENLCYLAIHNHHGSDTVGFSRDDYASHERGYPALLDITNGGPVGALVFAKNAIAGDIWTREGRQELGFTTVIGMNIKTLYPAPTSRPPKADLIYDRSARLFGDLGQYILSKLKVGIIGLGGGGSLINEWLARLGVGHIVAVDFDKVDVTNLPRIAGATRWDACAILARRKNRVLQKLASHIARPKVFVAKRVAKQANPNIRYDSVIGDVMNIAIARFLSDVDFLFLASDSMQSRLVFNALVQQYLIPGAQVGAKVTVGANKRVCEVFTATRLVLPFPGGGCLECHELISPNQLRLEALSRQERRAQRYVEDEQVEEPSVITLNALSAAQAANDLMMMFTGLYADDVLPSHLLNFVQGRELARVDPVLTESCLDCGKHAKSRYARGDRARLPCRETNS